MDNLIKILNYFIDLYYPKIKIWLLVKLKIVNFEINLIEINLICKKKFILIWFLDFKVPKIIIYI